MLSIFAQIMSLAFVEILKSDRDALSGSADVDKLLWHEDVRMFAVWDDSQEAGKQQEFLDYLYMDIYPRAGKDQGFACQPVRPVRLTIVLCHSLSGKLTPIRHSPMPTVAARSHILL